MVGWLEVGGWVVGWLEVGGWVVGWLEIRITNYEFRFTNFDFVAARVILGATIYRSLITDY